MLLVRLRAVGRIRPHVARRVLFRDEVRQLRSVVTGRVRCRRCPDEPMAPVDGNVVFVPKSRDGNVDARRAVIGGLCLRELHRPACIAILLRELGRLVLPSLRDPAGPDIGLLAIGVALTWAGSGQVDASGRHRQASGICFDPRSEPDCMTRARLRARSNSHPVAVRHGCTTIRRAAGKGSGRRDHSA